MAKTKEYIDKLFEESGNLCIELKGMCQKCKGDVSIVIFKEDMDISGNGGMIVGDQFDSTPQFKCTKCLEEDGGMISPTRCEVFSRVVGYLRPVQAFNKGKQEEFKARINYNMEK